MIEPTDEEVKEFLEELTQLSIRHKIEIAGCGCCGSPALVKLDHDGAYDAVSLVDEGHPTFRGNLEFKKKK
jgi:hypothetical protein